MNNNDDLTKYVNRLTVETYTGFNWNEFSYQLKRELKEKKLHYVIDQEAPTPPTAETAFNEKKYYRDWLIDEQSCQAVIMKAAGPGYKAALKDVKTAKEMLTALEGKKVKNELSIIEVEEAKWEAAQWDYWKVSSVVFFGRLDQIKETLSSTGATISDAKFIAKIFKSIPAEWKYFADAYRISQDEIKLDSLRAKVLEKELHEKSSGTGRPPKEGSIKDERALKASEIKCYDCGKKGHYKGATECPGLTCFNCNEVGHASFNCPKKDKK